jgi:hypothetical protein
MARAITRETNFHVLSYREHLIRISVLSFLTLIHSFEWSVRIAYGCYAKEQRAKAFLRGNPLYIALSVPDFTT